MLDIDGEQLDALVVQNFGQFRKDGTMKTTTARKLADQQALTRLRESRALPQHPDNHIGHSVGLGAFGPRCRECNMPLFDWPESRALVND
jgi:hypothetical protein